jgi:hypothetical protein
MNSIKLKIKIVIPALLYWCGFLLCLFLALFLSKIGAGKTIDFPGYIIFFLLFLYPFLFYIPYKLTNLRGVVGKIMFIVLFLVIPFLIIYMYTYQGFLKASGSINIL